MLWSRSILARLRLQLVTTSLSVLYIISVFVNNGKIKALEGWKSIFKKNKKIECCPFQALVVEEPAPPWPYPARPSPYPGSWALLSRDLAHPTGSYPYPMAGCIYQGYESALIFSFPSEIRIKEGKIWGANVREKTEKCKEIGTGSNFNFIKQI